MKILVHNASKEYNYSIFIKKENYMSAPIIAGIINLKTGEITDTTTLGKDKVSIRLKVRDELGCKHGVGEFMAFEFGITSHMGYYRKQMINKCPDALNGLQILNIKYLISESRKYVEKAKGKLELAESVAEECAGLYNLEEDVKKLAFINDLTEIGVQEAQEELSNAKSALNNYLRKLVMLENT